MILIIAEKPSLARNIVAGIGGKSERRDGFIVAGDYYVCWAFGHLFSLADIEHYNPRPEGERGWTMKNLPCFPTEFCYELRRGSGGERDDGVQKQFGIIEQLCNRPDVDTIVNAGDADREGEIIVRLCIRHALKTEKAQKRLWLPDQTPETVRRAHHVHGDGIVTLAVHNGCKIIFHNFRYSFVNRFRFVLIPYNSTIFSRWIQSAPMTNWHTRRCANSQIKSNP